MPFDPSRHYVSCIAHRSIHRETESSFRALEDHGVRVERHYGSPWLDVARSVRATAAMDDGYESILFIDSDIAFHPDDAIRLLGSPIPLIGGVYSSRHVGPGAQLNAVFPDDVGDVEFGNPDRPVYPADLLAAGFLRIKTDLLRTLADQLKLPRCNMNGSMAYPFFMPLVADIGGEYHYLAEDYAFCYRCLNIGHRPFVDAMIRLGHIGDYAYHLEEGLGELVRRKPRLTYHRKAE